MQSERLQSIKSILQLKLPQHRFFTGGFFKTEVKHDRPSFEMLCCNTTLNMAIAIRPSEGHDDFERMMAVCDVFDTIVVLIPEEMADDDVFVERLLNEVIDSLDIDDVVQRDVVKPHQSCASCKTVYGVESNRCGCGGVLKKCDRNCTFHSMKTFGQCPSCKEGYLVKRINSSTKVTFLGCTKFRNSGCKGSKTVVLSNIALHSTVCNLVDTIVQSYIKSNVSSYEYREEQEVERFFGNIASIAENLLPVLPELIQRLPDDVLEYLTKGLHEEVHFMYCGFCVHCGDRIKVSNNDRKCGKCKQEKTTINIYDHITGERLENFVSNL
eukprot:TRINITY_DN2776_c0_g1_i1.p1 TRINITY_DN2776_c0_g1~~TRINITY_DN2776_c0_g1_i1.p1  ORF type:complete len:333 (-),score=53.87 TRINITY_DN2776_c0_g1_i1:20-997(-)